MTRFLLHPVRSLRCGIPFVAGRRGHEPRSSRARLVSVPPDPVRAEGTVPVTLPSMPACPVAGPWIPSAAREARP